jgi:ribonuclease HI
LRGARLRRRREKATGRRTSDPGEAPRPLNILQWNAEGVYNKKIPLTERLHSEDIDVACIQETHLNTNNRFTIRGYQTFRMDREARHKGGVMILVKNSIAAKDFQVDTNQQAEIHGVNITVDNSVITIINLYCPQDKELSLQSMNIPSQNCLIVGDFNSHSTCWGYEETDRRGDEVEDWQIENTVILLNDPEDPPTFFSRRWISTSTPDIAFATEDLSRKTTRKVESQLAGSDHRPVLLAINLQYRPSNPKTFPRWNYKKADWDMFANLSDEYCKGLKADDYNVNRVIRNFNQAVLKAASETIPRGARKNYRPYWTEELQELEDEVSRTRDEVEKDPTPENNIALKACTAKYKKAYTQAARTSWRNKTEQLNLDKDGNKLWKLTKAMNDEETRSAPVMIEKDQEIVTGQTAANCFVDNYEQVSNISVPEDRKHQVHEAMKNHQGNKDPPEYMNRPFTMKEFEEAIKTLNDKKSPGPDKITNEMLEHLGSRAKSKLLKVFNNSWKTGHVPQCWRDADMVPVHKKGKSRMSRDSYRPISLTSCVGKLMERMINTRLVWHLEKNNIITPEQAGFRQHRSTEDQVTYIAQKIEDGFQDKQHTLTVWIDMEKAYDKVWKDGLRLKLQKSGVSGCMYQWISQYLNNRKARVHVNGTYSRKKTLKQGVPQGGVLSPTLFLVFINDIVRDLPRKVQGAIYADDLVLWCSEEHLTTANYRLQQALNILESWTKQWLVKINSRKTTYTVFSLSTKPQKANLHINGQTLLAEDNPTYLGVTFDKRMTWKNQTQKAESRAKVRLALMKKLAGTTWGADTKTLKRLYTGRVKPVLEYGMTAWGTTAKSNFDRVSRVQNQAARIITGAMKSTPIQELESTTGLQSLEDRRDTKILTQAAKFKRLQDHPMRERMSQPTKGRLKRGSFIHQSRTLERHHTDLLDHDPREIPRCLAVPAWSEGTFPLIQCSIPGVGSKDSQSGPEKKSYTLEHLQTQFPKESWTQVFTDGSAEDAVRNGGAGVYILYPGGREDRISLATGRYSTNYKAETEALKTGAAHIEISPHASHNVVFLTDALSVLQALQPNRHTELNDLSSTLTSLCKNHTVVLQWIPSHCNVSGNEIADSLAKEGTTKEQVDKSTSYPEAKTIIKAKQQNKWNRQHPQHSRTDAYYQLTRWEQVTLFRLRTGHNRLNHHLYQKLRIGQTEQCSCGTDSQTTEHVLQFCPLFEVLRKKTWPDNIPVTRKLFGDLRDLRRTAAFILETGLSI